jgi:hypothetical protein
MGCSLDEGAEVWLKVVAQMSREELMSELELAEDEALAKRRNVEALEAEWASGPPGYLEF